MIDSLIQKCDNWLWNMENPTNRINQSYLTQFKVMLGFRIIATLYISTISIMNLIKMTNIGANVMYMTMWGAYFVWAYFIVATLENLTYDRYRRKSFFNNLWKVAHFLFELAWVFQLVIVLIFWIVLFPQLFVQNMPMFLNVNIHGVFFVLLVLDFIINNVEFYHRHFYVIVFIALSYLLFVNVPFTLIWRPIYPGINWCRTGSTGTECLANWLIVLGALAMFILQYFIGYKIYKVIKEKRIMRKKQDQILGSISDSLTDESDN